jgi:FtsP/CotA-like multicopper oxidase with cupredoxin domain
MARGLYGALIVDEADPPELDQDVVLLIDDWRLAEDGTIHDSFGSMRDWSHAGRIGNWITVNGDPAWVHPARTRERLRLRLVNTANARVFELGWQGLSAWIAALDGMPLETPRRADKITLAPAQRVDLIADLTAEDEALIYSTERDGSFAIASFPVTGTERREALAPPQALPPNPVPALGDLDTARAFTLDMDGGAMGGMQSAMLNGAERGIRDLVQEGYAWAFNGMAGLPEKPLASARVGETIRIKMVNRTRWPHAMHLHGHHFRVLSADGNPGPLRDTTLMGPETTQEIAFVADNPGDWLLHCHMLEHAAAGMMTWVTVG